MASVLPRRFAFSDAGAALPDRGDQVSTDHEPCGIEYVCNLCGAHTLEAAPDFQGADWLEQLSRLEHDRQPLQQWWPLREIIELERFHARVQVASWSIASAMSSCTRPAALQ